MNIPIEACYELLIKVLDDTKQQSEALVNILQTIELLAIESPTLLFVNDNLLFRLLDVPSKIDNTLAWTLATKLLVFYAQNAEGREMLLSSKNLMDVLYNYQQDNNEVLLRSLANLSLHLSTPFRHRQRLIEDGMLDYLRLLQNTSNDKEVWNLSQRAIENIESGKPDDGDDMTKSLTRASSISSIASSGDIIIMPRRNLTSRLNGEGTSSALN